MTDSVPIPLKKAEFERALAELQSEFSTSSENRGSYKTEKSVRCFDCMFTTSSADCYKCTYCTDCQGCSSCTHCYECQNVHGSNYTQRSRNCTGCSYVVLSESCHECVFCFGCVGLVKKEFHILNQPFKRDEYFRLLQKLEAAFGLKRRR